MAERGRQANDADEYEEIDDDAQLMNGQARAAADAAPLADATYESDFRDFIAGLDLKHFASSEFLILGGQNFSGPCAGLNHVPDRGLWNNIAPTAKVLDALRARLGAAIRTTSVYRSQEYNGCIPGAAGGSVHKQFRAVDFKCSDGNGPVHWAKALKAMRDDGVFKGGIGVYQTFVHVDTRGTNANFGPLMNQVF